MVCCVALLETAKFNASMGKAMADVLDAVARHALVLILRFQGERPIARMVRELAVSAVVNSKPAFCVLDIQYGGFAGAGLDKVFTWNSPRFPLSLCKCKDH